MGLSKKEIGDSILTLSNLARDKVFEFSESEQDAIVVAIMCMQKCTNIEKLYENTVVDKTLPYIEDKSFNEYMRREMCHHLVDEALKHITITVEDNKETMERIYRAVLEVVVDD